MRRRVAERPGRVSLVEAEQFPGRGSSAEDPAGRGDLPAAPVMRRHDAEADAALGLDPEDQGVHQLGARHPALLGEREEAGYDRRCRVDHRRQMRVVIFEDIGADRVEKRGVQRIRPLAAADDAGLGRAEIGREYFGRKAHRLVTAAAERAADKVQQRAHALMPHRFRDVPPA